jgi:hypothetical protein
MVLPEADPDRIDEAGFRRLADHLPILCWLARSDGYLFRYNRRWLAYCALITGMEDLLRRTLGERVRPELVTAGGLWLTPCDPHQLENALSTSSSTPGTRCPMTAAS